MTKFINAITKLFSILIQAFVSLNKKITNFENRERKNTQTNRVFSEKVFRLAIVLLVLVSAFNFDYELDYFIGIGIFLIVVIGIYKYFDATIFRKNLSDEVQYTFVGSIFVLPIVIATIYILYTSFYEEYSGLSHLLSWLSNDLSWLVLILMFCFFWKVLFISQQIYSRQYTLKYYCKFWILGLITIGIFVTGAVALVTDSNNFSFLFETGSTFSRYDLSIFGWAIIIIIVVGLNADMLLARRLDKLWECDVTKEKISELTKNDSINQIVSETTLSEYALTPIYARKDIYDYNGIQRFDFIPQSSSKSKWIHTRKYDVKTLLKPNYKHIFSSLYVVSNCKVTNSRILFVGSKAPVIDLNYSNQHATKFGIIYYNQDYDLVVVREIAQVVDVISKTNKNIAYSQLLFTKQGLFEITPISYWQAPPLLIASNNQLDDYLSKRSQLLTKHIEHLQLFEKIRN